MIMVIAHERARGRRGLALGSILLSITLVGPSLAAEDDSPTRIDLFDKSGNRTGVAIIDRSGERVDFYDRKSNRTGFGTIDRSTGRIDTYDRGGRRTGSGTWSGGSRR